MKPDEENMNLGLTKDEFELVINNSNNPQLIKGYIHKLDNCDLSRSAIELIRDEDLDSVNRITNEILLRYPTTSNKKGSMKIIIFSITLITLLVGFIILQKETPKNIFSSENLTNEKTNNNEGIKKGDSNKSEALLPLSKKQEQVSVTKLDSNNNRLSPSDSLLLSISTKISDLPTRTTNTKIKTETIKDSKNSNSKFTNNVYVRKVRSIKLIKQIPDKYKNEENFKNDLVDFHDGNKNLEKELLNQLKGKIKDTHIPKKNTSIVFKFSVTSNGKTKDVNIQSRVNIELEEIIKETVLNLITWTKGNKKIPVIYTVYITYK